MNQRRAQTGYGRKKQSKYDDSDEEDEDWRRNQK